MAATQRDALPIQREDHVFHLARSQVRSPDDPEAYLRVNTLGTACARRPAVRR
jgi:hypothetical protein